MRCPHNQTSHPLKSMCPSKKSRVGNEVIREYKQSLKERVLYHYVSDLIDGQNINVGFIQCVP